MRRLFAAVLFAAAPAAVLTAVPLAHAASMGDVTIETEHTCVGLRVELAITAEERRAGLMHRTSVPEFGGMLFINPQPRVTTMWMKNTPTSLDMLFVDTRGEIVRIARETTPESLERISSGKPVKAVLEIGGGRAETLGIDVGHQLRLVR